MSKVKDLFIYVSQKAGAYSSRWGVNFDKALNTDLVGVAASIAVVIAFIPLIILVSLGVAIYSLFK